MKLNKNSSYVLLYLLRGYTTALAISEQLQSVDIRSIQRSLIRLVDLEIITRRGVNSPTYSVNYEKLVTLAIPEKLLENEDRPTTSLNHFFIEWISSLKATSLDELFSNGFTTNNDTGLVKISAKELEYLTIELSWKSSALEGNTYTLLDTQLLLIEGVKAKNRTEFETQMILNHKNAISFIVENGELFTSEIAFSTVEELHRIIGYNLGIENGVRKKIVRISASNYEPLAGPQQLRKNADVTLSTISRAINPFAKALLALALIPYLQVFEDGNKRTGRMLANAVLISSIGRGFSLRKTDARTLALAYLSFYEFNSISALTDILSAEKGSLI
jgi:Fic family protein